MPKPLRSKSRDLECRCQGANCGTWSQIKGRKVRWIRIFNEQRLREVSLLYTDGRSYKPRTRVAHMIGGIYSSRPWSRAVDRSKLPKVVNTYCLEAKSVVQAGACESSDSHPHWQGAEGCKVWPWNLCHAVLDPVGRTAIHNQGPRVWSLQTDVHSANRTEMFSGCPLCSRVPLGCWSWQLRFLRIRKCLHIFSGMCVWGLLWMTLVILIHRWWMFKAVLFMCCLIYFYSIHYYIYAVLWTTKLISEQFLMF
jgi:hypothetical protein